jgi:outer membrane lipoprotein
LFVKLYATPAARKYVLAAGDLGQIKHKTSHQEALPMRNTILLLAVLLVNACVTRFDIGTAEQRVSPQQAASNIGMVQGKTIAWGGIIVSTKNLASQTQLEVLSYPLDDHGRPDRAATAQGRFIALHSGYLELANYAEGRLVTMTGAVSETRAGNVGEAHYQYPVLTIKTLFLWPTAEEEDSKPQFHFGVGVGIGL